MRSLNDQRRVVYAWHESLLDTDDVSVTIADLRADKDGPTANKVLHVVAAAIFDKQGDLLIVQRPQDKHMGGNFLVVRWRLVKPLLMLCAVSWARS